MNELRNYPSIEGVEKQVKALRDIHDYLKNLNGAVYQLLDLWQGIVLFFESSQVPVL